MADLTPEIETNAGGPKRASGDAGSVEAHSLTEQIEADRYLKSQEAATKPKRGLLFGKFRTQGAV